ncbi:MAG TPA: MFS transporter [Actinomycetota bacterium]|nr:MFS transporter [Actinomycetota bacterium]
MSPRVEAAFHRTFSSARGSRNFRLYLIGQLVSAAGTWMHFTASSWLVLQLSGSGTAIGVNAALQFGPMLLLGPWGGLLADRIDKRRILMATQAAFGVLALTMFGLIAADAIALWMVYSLSLVTGVVNAFDNPTRQSFYVEMVGEDGITNAVSLNSAAFTGARIIGPAIAGVLISAFGIEWPFLIDGVSYLAVIGALTAMRTEELIPQRRADRRRGQLVDGLRYVWSTPNLRRPLMVLAVIFTVSFQFMVLVPLLAERVFDGNAGTFGLLSAVAGLGSFAGAITMANRAPRPTYLLLGAFGAAFGLGLLVIAASPSLLIALVSMVPLGFVTMAFMITGNTMLQVNARPEARGRVMALYGAVFLGSTPIGSPIVGWFAEHVGVREGFVLTGAVALLTGAAVLWARHRAMTAAAGVNDETGASPAAA